MTKLTNESYKNASGVMSKDYVERTSPAIPNVNPRNIS